ncbi:MAG: GC-type dockerin domain-anchored protein [Phycisphaerales bacterium]
MKHRVLVACAVLGLAGIPPCYANCDGSSSFPVLNINDFICFLNRFAQGDSYANCDVSTIPPVLNVNDFVCFLNAFSAACN